MKLRTCLMAICVLGSVACQKSDQSSDLQMVDEGQSINCEFKGNRLFVQLNGQPQIEKYSAEDDSRKVRCLSNSAVGVSGPYFYYSDGKTIQEKFVGSSDVEHVKLVVGTSSGAAIMGDYFLSVTNGKIVQKFIGSSDDHRTALAAGKEIIGGVMGSYFVYSIKGKVGSEYIDPYNNYVIRNKGSLIAASVGSYFIVVDGKNKKYAKQYVGGDGEGKISIHSGIATLENPSGKIYTYDMNKGSF